MADTKISALSAATAVAAANELAINEAGTSKKITAEQLKDYIAPRGYLWGLTMSLAADPANDITVAAGEAKDEAGARMIVLAAPITKRIDAGWAVGTDQGGLNTGAVANTTWYEVHLIKRVDTGVVDVMFTTTANRATLPAN